MKLRSCVLFVLVGILAVGFVELLLSSTSYGDRLEAFDSVIPLVSAGMAWVFSERLGS